MQALVPERMPTIRSLCTRIFVYNTGSLWTQQPTCLPGSQREMLNAIMHASRYLGIEGLCQCWRGIIIHHMTLNVMLPVLVQAGALQPVVRCIPVAVYMSLPFAAHRMCKTSVQ